MGGAKHTDPFTPDFDKFVNDTLDEWKLAGLSIAVVDGDDVYAKGFGYATLPDKPATPETLWYAGSTTKAFVTVTLAHMMETGKYPALSGGWQTPVSSIIRDDFVTQDVWATENLTLEDLACHRSGLSNNDTAIHAIEDGREWTAKDIVRNLRNFPLSAQPRTEFSYNNEAYATLSHVIETLTDRPLKDVIKETVWGPLGMNSTYLDLQEAKDSPDHLSTGNYWNKEKDCFLPIPFPPTGILSGAGAIISNVLDYTKWVRCLLRQEKPLSKNVHKQLRRPLFVDNPDPADGMDVSLYGLSWWRTSIYGHVLYWHSGSTVAHGALVYWFPELDYSVVIMANYPNAVRQIVMRRLVEDKLGVPLHSRYDIAEESRKAQREAERDAANADETLFPNMPKHSKPPSLGLEELSGKYHAAGFGTFHFVQASGDEGFAGGQLIADRTDLLWRARFTLRHVSGDFWVLYVEMLDAGRLPETFLAAEFRYGVDGKPSGLEVTFSDREGANGGKVLFKRL